jgi:hypothetical protein
MVAAGGRTGALVGRSMLWFPAASFWAVGAGGAKPDTGPINLNALMLLRVFPI